MKIEKAKKILEYYGYAPVTGLIDVTVNLPPKQKETMTFEELYERATEGWGFGGHTGKVKEILLFEGNCNLIDKRSRRKTRRHSYRESCLYISDYITKKYQLSPDFCGIFVTETDRVYAGNVINHKESVFIKNPLSSVKIRFVITEEGANGYILDDDYKLLLNKSKGTVCKQITVYKELKEQAQKEADRVKTALSVLGLENVEVKTTFAYQDKRDKKRQLKEFEAEVKKRYEKALKLLQKGYKLVSKWNPQEQIETQQIGNIEIYHDENTWYYRGNGYEKTAFFGIITHEVDCDEERGIDYTFEITRSKARLLGRYYSKLMKISEKNEGGKNE